MKSIYFPTVEVPESEYAQLDKEFKQALDRAKHRTGTVMKAQASILAVLDAWATWLRKNQGAFHRDAIEALAHLDCIISEEGRPTFLLGPRDREQYAGKVRCKVTTITPNYPEAQMPKVLSVHFRYDDEAVSVYFDDRNPWYKTMGRVVTQRQAHVRMLMNIYNQVESLVSSEFLVQALIEDAFTTSGLEPGTVSGDALAILRGLFPHIFPPPDREQDDDC